jgi:formiminotetrahydrofolate cyclodeaminase
MFCDGRVDCSYKTNTYINIMPRQTKSDGQKALDKFLKAAKSAPKETPEQKKERETKRAIQEARYAASNAAFMAAYRAAHPVPEIATGSPYQEAREAWASGQSGTDGAFDHWSSSK